jgi:hypothetical protein
MSERGGGERRPAAGKHLLELDVLAEADDAALLGRAVARLVLWFQRACWEPPIF